MLFQVNDRVHKRCHLKSVRSLDAAFRYVAVLNVECSRCSGGKDVSGVPALDAAVQGYQTRRSVGHVCYCVVCMNFTVVNTLDQKFIDIRYLIRGYQLRTEGEEGREVLYDS